MHQPGERPDRDQCERGEGMQLEQQRDARHQRRIRPQHEHAAEPDRHGVPVVMAGTEHVHTDSRCEAEHHDQPEHQVHDDIHDRGAPPERGVRDPARDEQHQPQQRRGTRERAGGHRDHVVHGLPQPDALRPCARHEQTQHMTDEHREHAEVDQRRPQAEQAVSDQRRSERRPAEPVVPPSPCVAQHEHGERQVRKHLPEQCGHVDHLPAGLSPVRRDAGGAQRPGRQ